MYSVHLYLKRIRNPQTKWIVLQWLRRHDAARPSVGLAYRYRTYRTVRLY